MDRKESFSKQATQDVWLVPSEQGYKDRKMAKWQGFILSDHSELIQKKANEQKKNPSPKARQSLEVVSCILKEAYISHKKVVLQIDVIENGDYVDEWEGSILGIDQDLLYIQTKATLQTIQLAQIRSVDFSDSNPKWYTRDR